MRLLLVATVARTLKAFLLPFAQHFRAAGWVVHAAASGISSSADCEQVFDRTWDIDWSRRPTDPRNFLNAVGQIRELLRKEDYDIVHVHTPVASFITRYALRRDRKAHGRPKVIYTAHGFHFYRGGPILRNFVFLALEWLAGRWTDYLVVINHEDEEAARRYRLLPPDRVLYMPGIGVDTRLYSPGAVDEDEIRRVRQEIDVSEKAPIFLMIGEFNPGKRHRDAVRALAMLGRPDVHLVFAGTGPLMGSIRKMADDLGLAKQVHFLGFRKDVPALIRASVATILPSEREGLPRSIMESLCLGVPAIGSNVRGIRDLLSDGAGLLIDVGRPDQLAGAMEWVLGHPAEARLMGERGREQMATYDIRRIIALHEELYDRALSEE